MRTACISDTTAHNRRHRSSFGCSHIVTAELWKRSARDLPDGATLEKFHFGLGWLKTYGTEDGSALDALSQTGGIKNVDGYFYVISSKRLCDDGLGGWNEGTLGICWAMTEFAAVAEGRSTEG